MQDLEFAAVSHRGVVRRLNEDSLVARPPVFCVADGIGGSDAGEVASSIVVAELGLLADRAATESIDAADVSAALARAHDQVREVSEGLPNGAASTAAGAIALEQDGRAYWLVFNIGDSRVYRCIDSAQGRRIRQVSVDHSVVQDLIDRGALTRPDAYDHPDRNVVTRAVGAADRSDPDFWMLPMEPGERVMICSDGLLADSPAAQVRQLIRGDLTPRRTVDELLELALRSGARDNVSVIVIDVPAGAEIHIEEPTVVAERRAEATKGRRTRRAEPA